MRPFLSKHYGNPSSHHWAGAQAKPALEKARNQLAALLGCSPKEIVFTSGGTEAIKSQNCRARDLDLIPCELIRQGRPSARFRVASVTPSTPTRRIASHHRREDVAVMKNYSLRCSFTACLLALFCIFCAKTPAQQTSPAVQAAFTSSADAAIPTAQLLQPAELMQVLHASKGEKPLILQVGSHVFYAEAHVPGSEYLGAGGQDSGLQTLRERVMGLERSRFLVIYCGCCPWNKCPNIRPAYQQLSSLGFTRVKALYIAANFGTDWVAKGYPVAKGR